MVTGSDDLFSVRGQVVLVSGASRGIGWAIAEGFAARGASVVITGRERVTLESAAARIESVDGPVRPIVCDVADAASISRLTETVLENFGRIDALINVAGVNRRKPAVDFTPEDYDFVLDINLKGAFLLSQSVGRHMIERGSGCQINVASLNNFRPVKGVTPYAISKAGLLNMTRSLAMEWGPAGVRVNALAPGFILTDLTQRLWSEPHMQAWNEANCPLRRLGLPGDMVGTAIFLASKASAFMTGQILYVDGGFSCGIHWPIDFQKQ